MHIRLSQAAIALAFHDSCSRCDKLFVAMHNRLYAHSSTHTLSNEVHSIAHTLAKDMSIFSGAYLHDGRKRMDLVVKMRSNDNTIVTTRMLRSAINAPRVYELHRATLTDSRSYDLAHHCGHVFRENGIPTDKYYTFTDAIFHEAYLKEVNSKYKIYTLILVRINELINAQRLPPHNYASNVRLSVKFDPNSISEDIHTAYGAPKPMHDTEQPDIMPATR